MPEHLLVDRPGDGVLRVTFNRADRLNAINLPMSEELLSLEESAAVDTTVNVVIYRATGRAFCVGRDLKDVKHEPTILPWMSKGGYTRAWSFPKPTIACVQGLAIGGGALIASACDITLATDAATFSYPELRMGVGDVEGHPWIWQLGPKLAKELLLTGRRFSAAEAERAGLVNRVVPAEELDSQALELAADIVAAENSLPGITIAGKAAVNRAHAALSVESFFNPAAVGQIQARASVASHLEAKSRAAFGDEPV